MIPVMAREVVTLSLGGLANFTAAHVWNFQARSLLRFPLQLHHGPCGSHVVRVQDELLGLEQQDETWAGVHAGTLFRFAEDAQARLRAAGHSVC